MPHDADPHPLCAQFLAFGGHRDHAGRIDQDEEHIRERGQRAVPVAGGPEVVADGKHQIGQVFFLLALEQVDAHDERQRFERVHRRADEAGEDLAHVLEERGGCATRKWRRSLLFPFPRVDLRQGAHHDLFGDEARHQRAAGAPVAEARRAEDRREAPRNGGKRAVLHVGVSKCAAAAHRNRQQHPDDDAGRHNQPPRLAHKAAGAFPHVKPDSFEGGQPVGRQLHYERRLFLALEHGVLEKDAEEDRHNNAGHVHPENRRARIVGEEDGGEKGVHRQARAAAHKRHEQAGEHAILLIFQRARGVEGGHGAAKADDHRQEALAVQAQRVHQAIHHEGGARHVAGVFQQRQRQVQRHHHRDENQHAPHPRDDAVHEQAFDPGAAQAQ